MSENELRSRALAELQTHGNRIGYKFRIPDDGVWQSEGWWHVLVEPIGADVRVYQYADILSIVEQDLTDELKTNILLVPAMAAQPE